MNIIIILLYLFFILAHLAVRELSLVNGCGCNTGTTKRERLFFSAVCINRSANIQRRESNREED